MEAGAKSAGTWLCPTEFDRARLLDMEERLQSARAVMYGSLGVSFVIGIPWVGWFPLPLMLMVVASYAAIKPRIHTSPRPEYLIGFTVVLAQVLVAVGVVITGGPTSPALLLFMLGVVTLPARFGTAGVVAGVALTEVLLFGAAIGPDPAGFAAQPQYTVVAAAACFGLAAFAHALMRAESEKRSDSVVDPLTGLPNRRGMEARFEELRRDAAVSGASLALLLCDLDEFKTVNDDHGHQRGDSVLKGTADAIQERLRSGELVYRIGGEEFLLLLPGCDLEGARSVAERVREAVETARPSGLRAPRSAWAPLRARTSTSTSCSARPTALSTTRSAPGATASRWLRPPERRSRS